jgi:hypothetical protein
VYWERFQCQRKGSSAVSRYGEKTLFKPFVDEMEVVDVSVLGKQFKWVIAERKSMSKLDRFLLSNGFIVKNRLHYFLRKYKCLKKY